MKPLSNLQKSKLAQLARRAYDHACSRAEPLPNFDTWVDVPMRSENACTPRQCAAATRIFRRLEIAKRQFLPGGGRRS